MGLLAFLPVIREIVELGQTIASNVRARREARAKKASKKSSAPKR